MEQQPQSKAEQNIAKMMAELDPDSERYQVLAVASRFKSSWVALGEKLLHVQRNALFQQWGYENFEDYCNQEVHIKKPTAQKLTLAYRFMEKEEPQLMNRSAALAPPPDYRSVELLRQAREEQDFSPEEYAALRQAVIEENRSHPTIRKRFNEISAQRNPVADSPDAQLKTALAACRRLLNSLDELDHLPEQYCQQLTELEQWLEGQREARELTPPE
jgi:hypothetical protein